MAKMLQLWKQFNVLLQFKNEITYIFLYIKNKKSSWGELLSWLATFRPTFFFLVKISNTIYLPSKTNQKYLNVDDLPLHRHLMIDLALVLLHEILAH